MDAYAHRRSEGEARGAMLPPKVLENIVILCFERRFSKQNNVFHLKSNIWPPQKIFGPDQTFVLATPLSIPVKKKTENTAKNAKNNNLNHTK